MAETDNSQEKTQEPTAKKLADSRKKGESIRSRELNTMIVLVISSIVLGATSQQIILGFQQMMELTLDLDRRSVLDVSRIIPILSESAMVMLRSLIPFFVLITIAAFIGPLALGGWVFSADNYKPKFSRMSPLAGVKRMFGLQGLIEMIKALGKFVIIGVVSVVLLEFFIDDIISLSNRSVMSSIVDGLEILGIILLVLSVSLVLIALIDVPYQIASHKKKLKMSVQEVKKENKETLGNPEIKSRIRGLQREVSQRQSLRATTEADVVIVNPEHYSVALKYDEHGAAAPVVVSKGVDFVAIKIREIAAGHNISVYSAPLLARSLFYNTEVGEEVPEDLYLAVAKILAYVYQLNEQNRSVGSRVIKPESLEIPEHYVESDKDRRD